MQEVLTRHKRTTPWYDDALLEYIGAHDAGDTVIAVDAPLTLPACIRCTEAVCPGQVACVDPAVVWLNTVGAELVEAAALSDRDRIAAVPNFGATARATPERAAPTRGRSPLSPYAHRPTAVHLRHGRQIETREMLGQGAGAIAARAAHLRRALRGCGYELNRNLIEVSPRATVHVLFGARQARGYKRDADPWETRASIMEQLSATMRFAPSSGLSREQVLRNDHCFEAVLSAYSAFLWARDDWQLPDDAPELFDADGWIWLPPE